MANTWHGAGRASQLQQTRARAARSRDADEIREQRRVEQQASEDEPSSTCSKEEDVDAGGSGSMRNHPSREV
jgi:hypothetical protein